MIVGKPRRKPGSLAQNIALVIILLVGLGLLSFGILRLYQHYTVTHNPKPVISKTIITHSTSTPGETPPTDACSTYKVAPDYPEKIGLPTINASGCVERVGIDQHGAIAVPDNIYTAAWYVNSALPGQTGLSVIDGHISGRYNVDGIFQHLSSLTAGDTFTVTRGDGTALHYRVLNEQSVPLAQAVDVLLTKDSSVESQLNLITCGGKYDRSTGLYDRRIIVSAALE